MLEMNESNGEIKLLESGTNTIKFTSILLQKFINTYFIVISTIDELMKQNIVIEQQKLVNHLHIGIQEMYNRGAIKFIDSCLIETINTAFDRFSELGVYKRLSYDTHIDSKIVYLEVPMAYRTKIDRYVQILTQLSFGSSQKIDKKLNIEKKLNIIEQEINKVIAKALGSIARL